MELEFKRKANAIYHKPNANALTRNFPSSIKQIKGQNTVTFIF